MTDRRPASDTQVIEPATADTAPRDGRASGRLREIENTKVMSRRGVLWRAAGLATGVVALTALEAKPANANTGNNFILGQVNDADSPTTLTPDAGSTVSPSPLMYINGGNLNATASSLIVDGPAGGVGIRANGGSQSATTIGLAIFGAGGGSANGVSGTSGSGSGVLGTSSSGNGVYASGGTGNGIYAVATTGYAIYGNGRLRFDQVSGVATIAAGNKTKTITPGTNVTPNSFVLLTAQEEIGARTLWATVHPATDKIKIHMSSTRASGTSIAWLLIR